MTDCCNEPNCRCHRFHNKVAIVTGAASGIGQACAIRFAQEKAKVSICDVNQAGLEETRQRIEALGRDDGQGLVQDPLPDLLEFVGASCNLHAAQGLTLFR